MYIIEFLIRYFKGKKQAPKKEEQNVMFDEKEEKPEDINTCSHIFVAIDSTEKTYACTKCGYVVSKEQLTKMKNFFMK